MTETPRSVPLAGVIGDPIAHSKSPLLHGHWLRTHGIRGHYVPLAAAAADFEHVVRTLPKMGFVGANVTIPHKERAFGIADIVTDRANLIGAVNTLTFRDDGAIHADNTDGYGFLANLRQAAPAWRPDSGPALVLGAGGASRAVVVSLIEAGVPEILVSNRTRARAEKLREDFGPRLGVVGWDELGEAMGAATLVVNTTSLGMVGNPELGVPLEGIGPGTTVSDLVYAPLETGLLRAAAERGGTPVDGLGMLLHQAVPGFERWFGLRPEVDAATREAVLR